MSIGTNIKNFRLKQKLKQSELAEKAGISRVAIGNYERDERIPNAKILLVIAEALNVTISDLVNLTPDGYNTISDISPQQRETDESRIKMNTGSLIKKFRKRKKYTQKQLANLIGKTESSIRKYEKGLIEIPNSVLNQIAEALNVTILDLMDLAPYNHDVIADNANKKNGMTKFEEVILHELKEIKKELQDIRSILEQQQEMQEDESMVETITTLIQEHQNSKRLTGLIPIE